MEKQDKIIVCQDCGEEFTFTVREQEFYANEPKRCKNCRDKRKAEKSNSNSNNH